ncbi:MAG: (2E,6E)-farnesyl diphosphate synthase [Gammaproteobacteria bacterium]
MPILEFIRHYQSRVESALERWLPESSIQPNRLHEAMRYAVLGDGKRIRPVLVYASGHALGVTPEGLDGPACAVELIHAYSLVHDDLPAMDDDELRRGRPTCHKAFDEATAILAGDALQALAFYILSHDPTKVSAHNRLQMIETLAHAGGSRGMAGGQALDLAAAGRELTLAELENMHIHKTGALIRACVRMGALASENQDPADLKSLDHFAKCMGLAFQIRDDILDIEGQTDVIGKPQGSDIARSKPTYPSLLGMENAKRAAAELHQEAKRSLEGRGEGADPLSWIADYMIERRK